MSYDSDLQAWREAYEKRLAAKNQRVPEKRDAWGRVIVPDPPEPPFDPARPIYEARAAGNGLYDINLYSDYEQRYYDLEGLIKSARINLRHELGATLEIYDQEGNLTRTLSWDGDRQPYPPPLQPHSA